MSASKLKVSLAELKTMVRAHTREVHLKDPFGLNAALIGPAANRVEALRRAQVPKSFFTIDPKIAINVCHLLLRDLRKPRGDVTVCGYTVGFNVAGGLCMERELFGKPVVYKNTFIQQILHYRNYGGGSFLSDLYPNREFSIYQIRGGMAFVDVNRSITTALHFTVKDGIATPVSVYEIGPELVCRYIIPDGTITVSTVSAGSSAEINGEPADISETGGSVIVRCGARAYAIANRAAVGVEPAE